MVRSGKNPLAQIAKRLGELDNCDTIPGQKHTALSIKTKRPDNTYIISNSSYCEVVAITNEEDDEQFRKLLCRVYEKSQPLFLQPCDSRTTGIYQVHERHSHMKMISESCLERKAMMVTNDHSPEIVFLAILHEF
ncbi:hypothetical protein ACJMK2_009624 [Sinanodonta woodiana]|uniref:Uncharacterized protein n=1 Tax=Sinanodonta woodiana TaxID=1069815 RepID=A0ABD3VCT9_SINWO